VVRVSTGATVYFDTNALIYLMEGTAGFKAAIEAFLLGALASKARLVTSELTITEVLVGPLRANDSILVAAYNELFESFVLATPIERSILVRAAQLRASTANLRTPDAIHLATAEYLAAEVFVTGDAGISVLPPMKRHLLSALKA
jgi:predicted nucleic acid-binding protein